MKIRWSQWLFHVLPMSVTAAHSVLFQQRKLLQVLLSLHYFYFSKISCTAAFYFFFFALVNWYLLALHVLVFHFLLQSTLLNLISVSHHFTAMERCQKDPMSNLRWVLPKPPAWMPSLRSTKSWFLWEGEFSAIKATHFCRSSTTVIKRTLVWPEQSADQGFF